MDTTIKAGLRPNSSTDDVRGRAARKVRFASFDMVFYPFIRFIQLPHFFGSLPSDDDKANGERCQNQHRQKQLRYQQLPFRTRNFGRTDPFDPFFIADSRMNGNDGSAEINNNKNQRHDAQSLLKFSHTEDLSFIRSRAGLQMVATSSLRTDQLKLQYMI
jgi:hypothetical protein